MSEEWTVERVKTELPQVQVRLSRRTVRWAKTSGRLNKIATVTISGEWSYALKAPWADFYFSWEAIVHSLNTNTPLEAV